MTTKTIADTVNRSASKASPLAKCWLAAFSIAGALLLSYGLLGKAAVSGIVPAAWGLSPVSSCDHQPSQTPSRWRRNITQGIETIRIGQRVLGTVDQSKAEFGELSGTSRVQSPGDWRSPQVAMAPAQLRSVRLAMESDGDRMAIELLRPLAWIRANGVLANATIYLELDELSVRGKACVLSVGPCPTIAEGNGKLVTGTIAHSSAQVLDLQLADLDKPIGVTAGHPFWSKDRNDFVPAGKLQPGETLVTLAGTTRVTSIVPRAGPQPVYNLEVEGEHVYRVSSLGVLVHNMCVEAGIPGLRPQPVASAESGNALNWLAALRRSGDEYSPARLEKLKAYLGRRGFTITHDEAFLWRANADGAFSADTRQIFLHSQPTKFEVWHELGHYLHYRQFRNAAEFNVLSTLQTEQHVYDMLRRNPVRWDQLLSSQEQNHSMWYIGEVGGNPW